MDLDVSVPAHGRHNTQARVVGHVGEREILTVNGALGARPGELSHQWAAMPEVAPPEACAPLHYSWARHEDDLYAHFDCRVLKDRHGAEADGGFSADGHVVLWARPRDGCAVDAGILSIFADFLPATIHSAVSGWSILCTSLDNTIRFQRIIDTDWVLCDAWIAGIHGNIAHGRMHLFAQNGQLMASVSQFVIVRVTA